MLYRFFKEPLDVKEKVSNNRSQYFNGYTAMNTSKISPNGSPDLKEGLFWRYDPKFDPQTKDLSAIPPEVQDCLRHEDFLWEGTTDLEGFKEDTIAYWQACLTFSRSMVRMFALCLGLSEEYFDHLVTYPGANGMYNFYPAMTAEQVQSTDAVDAGLGSHTDLMCFTLLWQDMTGGLQVLNKDGQWIKATPIEGTFVVNIGDFLMRLSNDKFKSTVHRVFNRATVDRISMPFFFGFNFNETCSVLPICTDEQNPPRYEPITCGQVLFTAAFF
jgi:isopenicillin N synthase-like dioxygenase